ncbi:hypothetical protein, partial [Fulvivirga aurantia]|uniref:hypothetical protein n=1 Tax=Fulvivirga aurantia TaxID=2529383 RepID=UPI001623C2BE
VIGPIEVGLVVNDGINSSNIFLATVTVEKVTNRPVITGLVQPLTTPEETPLSISLSDLTVEDADSNYPDDFTLTVQKG